MYVQELNAAQLDFLRWSMFYEDGSVEELRQDVNNYILSVFSTYYLQLDEDFINDIVKDVIETSNFENGEYSASDISLAFQRVVLGRMGCQDFKIYEGDNYES